MQVAVTRGFVTVVSAFLIICFRLAVKQLLFVDMRRVSIAPNVILRQVLCGKFQQESGLPFRSETMACSLYILGFSSLCRTVIPVEFYWGCVQLFIYGILFDLSVPRVYKSVLVSIGKLLKIRHHYHCIRSYQVKVLVKTPIATFFYVYNENLLKEVWSAVNLFKVFIYLITGIQKNAFILLQYFKTQRNAWRDLFFSVWQCHK